MSESETAEITVSTEQTAPVKDAELLARMVVREGKPFNSSALVCGYSKSIAVKGMAYLVRCSGEFSAAVRRETSRATTSLEALKPLAIQRLHKAIVNERDRDGMKAIELAGRFKETDWFVRNAEVQVGVFAAFAEPGPAAEKVIVQYPEDEA